MSILDWWRKHHEEAEGLKDFELETYVNGEKVPNDEPLTTGEGEGDHLPTIKKGSRGEAVTTLQTALNACGYDCGKADGIFGKKTKSAVEAFQKAKGLKVDGIVGRNTWTALGLWTGPVFVQPPNFKQYDSRWANKMYSSHNDKKQTMKSSACGPTAMAAIVAQWWDKSITPYDLAVMSMNWGTRTYDSGTSSAFFRKIHEKYGGVYKTSYSTDYAKNWLLDGGYVVVCFGPGTKGKAGYQKFTRGGHYCCLWAYEDGKFRVNDPASASAARTTATDAEMINCKKAFYCFKR